jgi:hypothetical protein
MERIVSSEEAPWYVCLCYIEGTSTADEHIMKKARGWQDLCYMSG